MYDIRQEWQSDDPLPYVLFVQLSHDVEGHPASH